MAARTCSFGRGYGVLGGDIFPITGLPHSRAESLQGMRATGR